MLLQTIYSAADEAWQEDKRLFVARRCNTRSIVQVAIGSCWNVTSSASLVL